MVGVDLESRLGVQDGVRGATGRPREPRARRQRARATLPGEDGRDSAAQFERSSKAVGSGRAPSPHIGRARSSGNGLPRWKAVCACRTASPVARSATHCINATSRSDGRARQKARAASCAGSSSSGGVARASSIRTGGSASATVAGSPVAARFSGGSLRRSCGPPSTRSIARRSVITRRETAASSGGSSAAANWSSTTGPVGSASVCAAMSLNGCGIDDEGDT